MRTEAMKDAINISREALLEWVKNQKAEATGVYGNINAASIDAVLHHNVANAIRTPPAVDAEPVRHGKWIYRDDGLTYWWECSICSDCESKKSPYCPNCGAKMEGGAE